MSAPVYKTLGELATELAARLGFAAQGEPTQLQNPHLFYLLTDAHEQLLAQYPDELLRVVNTSEYTVAGDTLYDIPDDCDPRQIKRVAVKVGSVWHDLKQGIEYYHHTTATGSYPTRYDVRYGTTSQGQIELWPEPSAAYQLWLEYQKRLDGFTDPDDPSMIPDRLVLLHALANAKAHYGRPDAQVYGAQLDRMLQKLRAQSHGNKRYVMGENAPGGEYAWAPDFDTQTV